MGVAVRANTVFVLCIFLYVFRERGDAYPNVATLAVPLKNHGGGRESSTTNLKSTKKTLHRYLRIVQGRQTKKTPIKIK